MLNFNLHLPFIAILLAFGILLNAQTPHIDRTLWQETPASVLEQESFVPWVVPQQFIAYELDFNSLRNALLAAPSETEVFGQGIAPLVMEIPGPDGRFIKFRIWYSPFMDPALQAQFPDIRSYSGENLDDPREKVFFDVSPKGLHAMTLRGPRGAVFIDPYAKDNTAYYVVYYKKDFVKKVADRMVCELDGGNIPVKLPDANTEGILTANCGVRREYRLAMACTGEYATFHGGTVASALAAINTSMTRVNGVYLTELSIQMNLIGNNNLIIYLDGATDPYTNNSGSAMLTENQANLTAVIGSANYDIGHVFSTGGGGVAVLQSPCNNSTKAKGVTGSSSPVGDPFDIDYVCHEIGHQFGCNHTFSSNMGSCSGNGTASTACEPGSGTTIMAYAGICPPHDVQNNSDPYFHAASLAQASNFVTGSGHTCDLEISNGNSKPVVAALTNVTFPKLTPFVLNGSATDPNGDAITYCWEQYNPALVPIPDPSNTTGPLFRSKLPVTESYRFFPGFDDVTANVTDPWEVLPGVTRTLTFRLTARDNKTVGGCTDEKNMDVAIVGAAGPFQVTYPDGGEDFAPTQVITVTWNVAGTTGNGINCANVDILISTSSYDNNPNNYTVLAAGTANDGTQSVTLPNTTSQNCRIMVRCAGGNGTYFYDLSNDDFSIGVYCYTFASSNVPVTIPLTAGSVTSTLSISGSTGLITDVNVSDLQGTHTWINDLTIKLKAPNGTERSLFANICNSQDNFNIKFDDDATNLYSAIPCPPTSGLYYKSLQTLSNFNGISGNGTWTLTITDGYNDDGGQLNSWSLDICFTAALPVELLSFDAQERNGTAQLHWETASEKDNEGYYIERSPDGKSGFETIGFVAGNGDSQQKNAYAFTDNQTRKGHTYYYRLRQMDYNGNAHYSDIRSVQFSGAERLLVLTPNPASEFVTLWFGEEAESATLKVLNSEGKLYYTGPPPADRQLEVRNWPTGVYFFQLTADMEVWSGRLVR